jgi:hypothetical protein
MDPILNPYAPGAGTPPPELAGRDDELAQFKVLLARVVAGRSERSMIITGLRGVGKTVLLNRFEAAAAKAHWAVAMYEVPGERDHARPFRDVMAELCRKNLYELSRGAKLTAVGRKAWGVLRSFRMTASINAATGELELSVEPVPGLADSGNLNADLTDLFVQLGEVARSKKTGVLFLLDEVQNLESADLAALITAIHRVDQKSLPLTVVVAGLPQLPGLAGDAKSYAERLFEYRTIGKLEPADARTALTSPAAAHQVQFTNDALDLLLDKTEAYPHFIQQWGKGVWNAADATPIGVDAVKRAEADVLLALDKGFFGVRFDRATPEERRYMNAMADLGAGPHRSGVVAKKVGKTTTQVAGIRDSLIKKGLIYSSDYGKIAFTVPHFESYLKRRRARP